MRDPYFQEIFFPSKQKFKIKFLNQPTTTKKKFLSFFLSIFSQFLFGILFVVPAGAGTGADDNQNAMQKRTCIKNFYCKIKSFFPEKIAEMKIVLQKKKLKMKFSNYYPVQWKEEEKFKQCVQIQTAAGGCNGSPFF